MTRKTVSLELSYKDTTGYFGIFSNKPSWWIMRVYIEGRKNWIGFNVDGSVGDSIVPEGMTRVEPHPFANFRVQVCSPEDINSLERLVSAAFEMTIRDRDRSHDIDDDEKGPEFRPQE